jgi:discoidin domain receptor family protein 2
VCDFPENIMRYNAPRGESREPDVDLEDISYDGTLEGSQMRGGLGQLVDGLYGDDDYQKQQQGENSGKNSAKQNWNASGKGEQIEKEI